MNAERIYRMLLRVYPPEFRAEFEREMVLLFRDQCRESDVTSPRFWAAAVWDVLRSALSQRLDAWGHCGTENTQLIEVRMKLAAMLTLLLGVLGIGNAVVEGVGALQGTIAGGQAVSLVLGIVAAAMLFAAGIAILRGTPGRQVARLALVVSVVSIVAARLLHPWMSVAAQLVGIGVPVALLIALYWPRRTSPLGAA